MEFFWLNLELGEAGLFIVTFCTKWLKNLLLIRVAHRLFIMPSVLRIPQDMYFMAASDPPIS